MDVLDRPKNDAEVTEARKEILERGVVLPDHGKTGGRKLLG
jgi:hypothetical protein